MFWHRFKSVKSILQPITKDILKSHDAVLANIYYDWKLIVGEKISSITNPEKIVRNRFQDAQKPGTLYLKIKHSSYVMELRFYEKMILEKVNIFLGYKAVDKIKYVHHTSARAR